MRLPGGVHGGVYKEHGRKEHARMVLVSGRVYGLQLLEKFLPPLEDSRPRSSPRKGFFSGDSHWFKQEDGSPVAPANSTAWPLRWLRSAQA